MLFNSNNIADKMMLYKCNQVNINNLSLTEIKHFFSSMEHENNYIYSKEVIENAINRITLGKPKNTDNLEYILCILLDYIFSSNNNIEKFATEAFRVGLIRLMKKDEKLVGKIRFILLVYGDLYYHLLTSSNIKIIEKTRTDDDTEYYKFQFDNKSTYERIIYRNSKWTNYFASLLNKKIYDFSTLNYYRTALCYMEIIYHFMIISKLPLEDVEQYLKITYFYTLKDAKIYSIIILQLTK